MSEPMPDDPKVPEFPESEARAPASPPVQGTAPAWDDEPGSTTPSHEQLMLEARTRLALREATMRDEVARRTQAAQIDASPLSESGPIPSARRGGFTVERGGRRTMAQTAERIGAAVGTAEREVRRRLEVVRRPTGPIEFPAAATASDLVERGARMMEEIDAEVADVRRQAARKLEDWSEQAEERFLHFRREARTALWRTGLRAQEIAETYPLQTIAAIAGTFFVIGAALRMRRAHRG